MTVVADLVARLRGETGDFDSAFNQSEAVFKRFGTTIEAESEKLSRVKELAGTAALAIGGTFAAGVFAAAESVKIFTQQTESMTVQFGALLGSAAAARNEIAQIRQVGADLGINDSVVGNAARSLQLLTQGAHTGADTLNHLADESAATGESVDQLANQFGSFYQIVQRGTGDVGRYTRELVTQGVITQNTANQLGQMAREGKTADEMWNVLIDSTKQYTGAARAQADTFTGLKTSIKNLVEGDLGTAFSPIIKGVENVMRSIKELLDSPGVKQFIRDLAVDAENLAQHFGSLVHGIDSVTSAANSGGIQKLVGEMGNASTSLATLTGLFAEFGVEIVGKLPIINRLAGPLVAFLDDGRGAMLGFLLSTKETREALGNLVGSVMDLANSLLGAGSGLEGILRSIAPVVAEVIDLAAAIVDFVAHHKEILAVAGAFIALWEAVKLGHAVADVFVSTLKGITTLWESLKGLLLLQKQQQESQVEGDALTKSQVTSTQELTAAVERLAAAFTQAAEAQGLLDTSMKVGTQTEGQQVLALEGLTAAEDANTVAKVANNTSSMGIPGFLGKGGRGLAIGGALAIGGTVLDQASGDNPLLHTLGQTAQFAGAGMMIGSMIPLPGASAVGAAAGAVVGLTKSIMDLGDSAHEAKSKMDSLAQDARQAFDKANPLDRTNISSINDYANNAAKSRDDAKSQVDIINQQIDAAKKQRDAVQVDPRMPGAGAQEKRDISSHIDDLISQRDKAQGIYQGLSTTATDAQALQGKNKSVAEAVAALVPGSTVDQVNAAATRIGVALADLTPGSQQSADALGQVVQALQATAGAAGAAATASFGSLTNAFQFQGTLVQGQTGNKTYDTGALNDLYAKADTLGVDRTDMIPRDLIDATRGAKIETQAYAEELLQEFDRAKAARDANFALGEALHGVQNAEYALNEAMIQKNRTQSAIGRDVTEFNNILVGQSDKYYDLGKSIELLAPQHRSLGEELQREVDAVRADIVQQEALQRQYTQQQDQLTVLNDQLKQFNDLLDHPLQGSRKYEDLIHQNQMAQDAVQMQIDRLKANFVYDQDPRILNLTFQLNQLKNAGDQLNLQKSLDLGDKQFQLDKAKDSLKEITFSEALTGAKNIGALNVSIASMTASSDKTKTSLDTVNAVLDLQIKKIDELNAIVQQLAATDESARQQVHSFAEAQYAVVQAQHAVANAYDQMAQLALQKSVDIASAYSTMFDEMVARIKQAMDTIQSSAANGANNFAAIAQNILNNIALLNSGFSQEQVNMVNASGGNPLVIAGITAGVIGGTNNTPTTSKPNYADGGIISVPHIAQLHAPEVVIPLSNPARARDLAFQSGLMDILGLSAGPKVSSAISGTNLTISDGAVRVDISAPGADPNEIAKEVEGAVSTALGHVLATIQSGRS